MLRAAMSLGRVGEGGGGIGFGQQDGEFLAAKAGDDVELAQRAEAGGGERLQGEVADLVVPCHRQFM